MATFTPTTIQMIHLFAILEVPYSSTDYHIIDSMGTLAADVSMSAGGQTNAKSKIEQYLTTLSNDAMTELFSLVDKWATISLYAGNLGGNSSAGGVGDINGLNFDWKDKRKLISDLVKNIVPFYRYHEVLARKAANVNSSYIPMII
jgi:hypothetical protein